MKRIAVLTILAAMAALFIAGCARKNAILDARRAPEMHWNDMDPDVLADITEPIHFDFDKWTIREGDDRLNMADKAAHLKLNPGDGLIIEGHADERGTSEYNMALSCRRAEAAKEYLIRAGIDESRLSTVGYGEEKPVDPGHDENAWEKNRRDEFVPVVHE